MYPDPRKDALRAFKRKILPVEESPGRQKSIFSQLPDGSVPTLSARKFPMKRNQAVSDFLGAAIPIPVLPPINTYVFS